MATDITGLNPETFEALNTVDLLSRAKELARIDPSTATLLRWAALEIDSLRDANLEAHGVTIIDGTPHRSADGDDLANRIPVAIIEARPDPKYGHTFKMPIFVPKDRPTDEHLPRLLTLS
jgi:hypothetical protein